MKDSIRSAVLLCGIMFVFAPGAYAQSVADEESTSYQHHRIKSNGVSIHAVSTGEGSPVILIHGFPQHWWMWRNTMQELDEAGFRAIAVDQRGMGGSDIPLAGYDKATLASDVIAMMDELGIEQASVVGYDHGGGTALAMAYAYPERVSRVAVLEYAPPGYGYEYGLVASPDNVNWQLSFFTYPDVAVEFIAGQERELLAWYFWHWSHNPDAIGQDDFEIYVRQLQKPGALHGGMMHFASVFEDTELFKQWASEGALTQPILGIGGELAAGEYMQALSPMGNSVSTVVIEDAGHWLVEEQPGEISRVLIDFLK